MVAASLPECYPPGHRPTGQCDGRLGPIDLAPRRRASSLLGRSVEQGADDEMLRVVGESEPRAGVRAARRTREPARGRGQYHASHR
jgi:hypothetical protein